jgi:hypothetical protein
MTFDLLSFALSNIFTALLSGYIGSRITLFLTDRKEKREAQVRFTNRLKSVAYELKANFCHVGNHQNPFQTKALENLVYNEPLIHQHHDLFEKAQKCLNLALILSTSKNPAQTPRKWAIFDERPFRISIY